MAAPAESAVPKSLLSFRQIKQEVAQCEQSLAKILSPAQKHEENVKGVRANLQGAWDRVFQNTDSSKRPQLQAEIQNYVGQLERLELGYKAGLADAEAEYERQVDVVVKGLYERIGNSLGITQPPGVEPTPNPTSDGDHEDGRDDSQGASKRPRTDRPDERPEAIPNAEAQTAPPTRVVNQDETRKRKRGRDASDQEKTPQPAPPQRSQRVKRSMPFADVFQGGKASTKHVIVQWPPAHGKWWIVHCREHDLSFKDHPLAGAAAHIRSNKHVKSSSDYNTVLGFFGIEVVGCNEALAGKNNTVAREAFKDGDEHSAAEGTPVNEDMASSQRRGRRHKSNEAGGRQGHGSTPRTGHQRQDETPSAVANPESGQVYCVYWRMSKQWLAALLLPMENLEEVGIPASIEGLGLLQDLPECYTYDPQSKAFSWSEGYDDNGLWVSMREFPIMFFDGSPFPRKSSVAWVFASELQVYDAAAENLIEHNQQVVEYLQAQKVSTESVASEPNKQAQSPGSPAPPNIGNQGAPKESQPDSMAAPISTPPVDFTLTDASSEHAPQIGSDTSSLQERPDQSPRDQSRSLAAGVASGEPNHGPTNSSMASSERQVSEQNITSTPQVPWSQDIRTVALAQMAFDAYSQQPSTTEATPTSQQHSPRDIPPMREQRQPGISQKVPGVQPKQMPTAATATASTNPEHGQQDISPMEARQAPAISQTVPNTHAEQRSTVTTEQTSQVKAVSQINPGVGPPGMVLQPLAPMVAPQPGSRPHQPPTSGPQLPPIRTLAEHQVSPAGHGYYWPNRSSVSSAGAFRITTTMQGNPELAAQATRPPAPAATMTLNLPMVPPSQNELWLASFSPSLVDLLRRNKFLDREPHPEDFRSSQGNFRCPFCSKEFGRLGVFTRHLQERCRLIKAAAQSSPSLPQSDYPPIKPRPAAT
ncbi:Fc.00g036690.m01.CDS01 [Cosmosporella sp. VM-42]